MSYLPADYETVADRLVRWWAKYPNGRIETTMVHYDAKTVVFRAMGYAAVRRGQPCRVWFRRGSARQQPRQQNVIC